MKEMTKREMRKKISSEIDIAKMGSGKLRITFKEDAINVIDHLCDLEKTSIILMKDCCIYMLSADKVKDFWRNPSNRVVSLSLGINFKNKHLLGLTEDIEDIEAFKERKKALGR